MDMPAYRYRTYRLYSSSTVVMHGWRISCDKDIVSCRTPDAHRMVCMPSRQPEQPHDGQVHIHLNPQLSAVVCGTLAACTWVD